MRANHKSLMIFIGLFLLIPEISVAVTLDWITVSPRMVDQDAADIMDRISTGLSVVGLGEKVYLRLTPGMNESLSDIAWTFTERPNNAQAAFLQDNQEITAFIPDQRGWYEVSATVKRSPAGDTITLKKRVLAALYVGVGGLAGSPPNFPECGLCHTDLVKEWQTTRHAHVLEKHLNGYPAVFPNYKYDEKCLVCHTTGFDPTPLAKNNGFDDAAEGAQFDLAQIPKSANEAYQSLRDQNPANDQHHFNALPNPLKARANVQCEICHGAGSEHFGITQNIAKVWDARVCARCHDAMGFNGYPYPYDSSSHKILPGMFQEIPAMLKTDCGRCHAADGFVRLAVKKDPTLPPQTDDPHAVSCVACHDPHFKDDRTNPKQLRIFSDVILESGQIFKDGGLGNLCVNCHQSRARTDLKSQVDSDLYAPHYGTQADLFLGENLWDFGVPFKQKASVHKLVVQNTCVACHMARIPANGWNAEKGTLVGGHSFKIVNSMGTADPGDDVSNVRNTCFPCHLTLNTTDRLMQTGKDYDGNGKKEGIQTEVNGLLQQIVKILRTKYPTITVSEKGNLDVSTVFYQMSFNEKAAVYNYHMILRDGSRGIHNPAFILEALQKTLLVLQNPTITAETLSDRLIKETKVERWSEQ